jgi:hypothetical protein
MYLDLSDRNRAKCSMARVSFSELFVVDLSGEGEREHILTVAGETPTYVLSGVTPACELLAEGKTSAFP